MSQLAVERELGRLLGVSRIIWPTGASPEVCESLGDSTDYHIAMF